MGYFDERATEWDQDPLKVERARQTADCVRATVLSSGLVSRRCLVDFGSGTGLLSSLLADLFEQIWLVDDSLRMLEMASEKIARSGLDTLSTFRANRLSDFPQVPSAIVTLMTLHHIVDIDSFFEDAHRLIESRGCLLIADLYAEDGSFHQHRSDFDGHNGFDVEKLAEHAEACGFERVSVQHYFDMPKQQSDGSERLYPLFFMVLRKV